MVESLEVKTGSRKNKIIGTACGILAVVGGFVVMDNKYWSKDREADNKQREEKIEAGQTSLNSFVENISSNQEYSVTVTNGVDWPSDSEAKILVTLGVCSGEIPLSQVDSYADPSGSWDREESDGKKNLLAIPDEFGNVMGYLAITPENIIASFPDSCAS